MFSSKSYLEKKTGPYGIGRLSYLQSLVVEYQDTTDLGKYIVEYHKSITYGQFSKILSVKLQLFSYQSV